MKINVYSLKEAENIISGGNWISIRDVNYDHLYKKIDEKADNILILKFDDITTLQNDKMLHDFHVQEKLKRPLVYFDENMAREIFDFAERKEEINIHCYAGISRSKAIGYVLNIYLNLLEGNVKDFEKSIYPSSMNGLVLDKMNSIMKEKINGRFNTYNIISGSNNCNCNSL